jgi:hypothetical protein
MSITFHVGVAKRLLREWILRDGAKRVLAGWTGTDAEALAALDADPRDVFVTCGCEKLEDGSCAGVRDDDSAGKGGE